MDAPQAEQAVVTQVPQFSVASVLNRSFSTLLKNPALFIGLAVIATVPEILIGLVASTSEEPHVGMTALLNIISRVCNLVLTGAIVYGVFCILRGAPATIGDAVKRGLARLGPLVIVSLIIGVATGIGFMLLIVPGIILMCMWAVTVPACVVERLGPVQSLRRSNELTSGYRWTIFGLFFLVGIIILIVVMAVIFIISAVTGSPAIAMILASLIGAVPAAFQSVMLATVYYDLRAVKEGVTVDKLANVFD